MNFASLFNQYRAAANNAINDILNQGEITLEKLLDEDSFLNEYKSGNTKLLEYLKYPQMKQLVNYIVQVGPEEDKKKSYKFPLAVSDILSCDSNATIQWFLPQGKLYHQESYYEDQQIEVEIIQDQEKNVQESQINQEAQTKAEDKIQEIQKTIIKDTLDANLEQGSGRKNSKQEEVHENIESKVQSTQATLNNTQSIIENVTDDEKIEASQVKKVKRIVKVEKIRQIEMTPLIFHLFNYFNGEVNYVLTGYVCKVLTMLFNKKPLQMMQFLFSQSRILGLLKHIQSRSIGEFLIKVLTYESNRWVQQRKQFFRVLILKLGNNEQIHVMSNFSSFLSQTFEKAALNLKSVNPIKQFQLIFFEPQIVTIIIKCVMSDYQNVCVYSAAILLTYLTNFPLVLPQNNNNQQIIGLFKNFFGQFIVESLQKLNNTHNRAKLGFGRVKIIQILVFILRQNYFGSKQFFGKQNNALQILFDLCKKYEMNNVLHNEVVKIIKIALLDKEPSVMCQSLLTNDVLLGFLSSQASQDEQIRTGETKRKTRKGYIGHIVQICRLIQEYAQKGNKVANQILERQEFQNILVTLVQRQISDSSKSLAGYRMKKNIKNEIMFAKQEILNHYFKFLSQCPKPVFEPEPVHVNIQHPDFVEELQRQIQQNMVSEVEDLPAEKNQPINQTSMELSEVVVHVNYFKGHLDFDLTELMEDL